MTDGGNYGARRGASPTAFDPLDTVLDQPLPWGLPILPTAISIGVCCRDSWAWSARRFTFLGGGVNENEAIVISDIRDNRIDSG